MTDSSQAFAVPGLAVGECLPLVDDDQLARIGLDDVTVATREWLTVPLLHPSFIAELPSRPSRLRDRRLQDLLAAVGNTFISSVRMEAYLNRNIDASSAGMTDYAKSGSDAIDHLAAVAQIPTAIRLGKGQAAMTASGTASGTLYRAATEQTVGALVITGHAGAASRLLTAFDDRAYEGIAHDPKTTLQETLGYSPEYVQVGRSGPDHDARFVYEVRLRDGRAAVGSGGSKKAATIGAAAAMLQVTGVKSSERTRRYVDAPLSELPVRHRQLVAWLGTLLDCGAERLLSQALIHSSWPPEHSPRSGLVRDNATLATIGSLVLQCCYRVRQASRFAEDPDSVPLDFRSVHFSETESRALCQSLELQDGLLLGKGQQAKGSTNAMLADAAEAVVGAAAMKAGVALFITGPPDWLHAWMDERVEEAVRGDRTIDSKQSLVRLLTPLGISHTFSTDGAGKDHARLFRSVLELEFISERAQVLGPAATSKRASEQAAARWMCRVLLALHRPWTPRARDIFLTDPTVRDVAGLLARAVAASHVGIATVDGPHGNRGALDRASIDEISSWLGDWGRFGQLPPSVTQTIAERTIAVRVARAQSPISSLLKHVIERVGALDLNTCTGLRDTEWFGDLLSAAALARLATRPVVGQDIPNAIEDWATLHRGRGSVDIATTAPAATLLGPEDLVSSLLTECERAARCWGSEMAVAVTDVVSIAITPVPQGFVEPPALECMRHLFGGTSIRSGDAYVLTRLFKDDEGADLARLYGREVLAAIPQSSHLAGVLHDLKNLIVAIDVESGRRVDDRSSAIERDLRISHHLDDALGLSSTLQKFTEVVAPVEVCDVEMLSFCRQFIGNKILSCPPTIQITPPSAQEPFVISTSSQLLRSILENLYRNAIEAMTAGGRLTLEWIADPNEGSVLLELCDSGPGLPDSIRDAVTARRPAASTKTGGSGLGLWAAAEMAERLNGALHLRPSAIGTRWELELQPFAIEAGAEADAPDDSIRAEL